MADQNDSPALAVARAHVRAWSDKDFDTARSLLAPDVHVIAISTFPHMPSTNLTGPDAYMEGLTAFASPIEPGSVKELSAVGDARHALITLDLRVAGGPFGAGTSAPCARGYLVEDGKIKVEQVVFYISH
jgi:hypothetical protein